MAVRVVAVANACFCSVVSQRLNNNPLFESQHLTTNQRIPFWSPEGFGSSRVFGSAGKKTASGTDLNDILIFGSFPLLPERLNDPKAWEVGR